MLVHRLRRELGTLRHGMVDSVRQRSVHPTILAAAKLLSGQCTFVTSTSEWKTGRTWSGAADGPFLETSHGRDSHRRHSVGGHGITSHRGSNKEDISLCRKAWETSHPWKQEPRCFKSVGSSISPFFLLIVRVGKSPIAVVFGILWNGGVVRVNVATLKGVPFGISHTMTKRLDLTSGSSLGFRLRPHNRRDPKPRHDRQNGTKKSVRRGTINRKKGVRASDGGADRSSECCFRGRQHR